MKIAQLSVKKLFGLYDYDLTLLREGQDVIVLTSPNGYGKTTLLRIISSLNIQRLFYLYSLNFKEIVFSFDDGSTLSVQEERINTNLPHGSDTRKDQRRGLVLSWLINGSIQCELKYSPENIHQVKIFLRRRMFSIDLYREDDYMDDSIYYSGENGEAFNTELARLQNQEQFFLQLAIIQTDFIGANRIYSEEGEIRRSMNSLQKTPMLTVVQDLRHLLQEQIRNFQQYYQRLDSKLIDTLLKGDIQEISETDYNKRSKELDVKISKLASYGFVNKQILPIYQITNSKILNAYLNIMEEKMKYFDEFLPSIEIFDRNIQQKHFADKSIKVSPLHGLRIESKNGDIISADKLSTGEQNQLVLLYDLIFKTPKNTILLIDEPESSLHVAWQNDFINDLQGIASSKQLQIIVASHSPIIVSNMEEENVIDLYFLQRD